MLGCSGRGVSGEGIIEVGMGGGVCWSGCELCGKGWIGKIFWRGFYSQEELMGMHLLLDVIAHCHFLQEEMGLFGEDDEGFVVAMTLALVVSRGAVGRACES